MNQQILDEASTWFIEFRSGPMSHAIQRQFMEWLRRSPDHIRAYLEISESYARLPAAEGIASEQIERLLERARSRATDSVIPLYELAGSARYPKLPNALARRASAWRLGALAASLLIACGAGIAWWGYWHKGLYTTQTAEQRTVTLDDGSRIELNARTRLRVVYSSQERSVDLLEGQALFEVAKDRSRPFIVRSGDARVRAVGTRFDVHRFGAAVKVTVLEGTVAVFQPAVSDFLVRTGEQTLVSGQGSAPPHVTNVAAATAWTRGQLEFDETPLSEVADDFNRYSSRRLVLESPGLADFRISGVYSSTDSASLILFLRSQPDFLVTETHTEVRVSRRDGTP